ncbi:MAG TPA: sulfur carrier protein ThiS [Phycisphaerales bacterium]|nr:sulfur carrier protein ThiS [Phycisphaerales bacterium]HMP38694.1 sulfur carrier protein ThiS [Phycisphaerales bacterium]
MIGVTVNGERTEVAESTTVAELLRRAGVADRPCAVEVNRTVVPRREHGQRTLAEGDVVEIVTLVGGG